MLKTLSAYIRKLGLLHSGDRIGLAVSGGADSVALLRAMLELRGELGIVLSVIHFHHGIRGADADADEHFVAELAGKNDLPFHCDGADVPQYAEQNSLSLEAAGRKLRYEFFARLLKEKSLDKIATAHTSDDQAETVLLRFLRGSGTRGLAGIHPVLKLQRGEIIRPMLGVSRCDVLEYLKSVGQGWREDATNGDTKHTRNRIRHELLPLLERDYNPNLRELLSGVAETAREEEDDWLQVVRMTAGDAVEVNDNAARIRLGRTGSPALRRRVIRFAAERLGLSLDFRHVEQLLALGGELSVGAINLPQGWRALRLGGRDNPTLVIEPATPRTSPSDYQYDLSIPSEVHIAPIGTTVRVTAVRYSEVWGRYNPASLLDAALLGAPLQLRNWRPGDRLRPLHRGSEEKLKRLFQEKHIPAEQRASWPVITSKGKIVWVRDFPVAADFAAGEGTSEAVLVEAVQF